MNKSAKIKFQFTCNQTWDDMPWREEGRYCERCEHQVLDLTQASWEQIEAASLQGSCGMLRAEQIEPDLIPLIMPTSLRAAFFSLAVIGVSGNAMAQSELAPKELSLEEKSTPLLTYDTTKVSAELPNDNGAKDECKPKGKRKRWYLSRSFPFIKRRVVRTMGRFRH